MKVIAKEAFLIRTKHLTEGQIEDAIETNKIKFYKEEKCAKCEYLPDRHCEVCEECPAYRGQVRLAKLVRRSGKEYLSLPIGDKKGLELMFPDEDIEIVPQYRIVKMRSSPEFIRKLRDYQKPAIGPMIQGKRGVLKSKPRTGKTVMAAYFVCRKKLKTIILAAQKEWLDNFHETFVGSDEEKPFTTMKHNRIGYAKKLRDFKKYDVCLVTYQTFLSAKGKKLLKKIKNMFSILIVDEAHRAGAEEHSRVLSKLATKYKIGLSGTPKRKDGRHIVVQKLMGPILYRTEAEILTPRIKFVPTGIRPYYTYRSWAGIVRFLETHGKRLRLLAKWAIHDVNKGHIVLIPLARIASIKALAQAINIMSGRRIAEAFHGGTEKEERRRIIVDARERKVKVIVGNIKLLSEGVNIPTASCIYQCTPSSNLPKAEQRFGRILTPMKGKMEPVIRVFGDEMDVVKACFRNEYWGCLHRMFRATMTDNTRESLMNWMKKKPKGYQDDFHSGGAL